MNKIFTVILILGMITSCNNKGDKKQPEIKEDTILKKSIGHEIEKERFLHHLKILDSAARLAPDDTINCCTASIEFMEGTTGIEADTDGSYVGPLSFLKKDLRKWHEWYDKEYGQK